MEFLIQYWYVIVGVAGGATWLVLFLNRDRIESTWFRTLLGLTASDPLLKAAMQGRKDFTVREKWGWAFIIVLMLGIVVAKLLR